MLWDSLFETGQMDERRSTVPYWNTIGWEQDTDENSATTRGKCSYNLKMPRKWSLSTIIHPLGDAYKTHEFQTFRLLYYKLLKMDPISSNPISSSISMLPDTFEVSWSHSQPVTEVRLHRPLDTSGLITGWNWRVWADHRRPKTNKHKGSEG